jgi:threonine dehydrogenase-like Zn-dependent dehydrogenase
VKAVQLGADGTLALRDVPVPDPAAGEIRIRVAAAGICGTDLSVRHGTFDAAGPRPLTLGHEFAGTVDALGADVTGFAVGEAVAADPNRYCGDCDWCRRGAYNLCRRWAASGLTLPGALAEFVCVPARFTVTLPDSVSFAAGAMIEPLSCAVHAFGRGAFGTHHTRGVNGTMVIYGAGTMGLACLVLAARAGYTVDVVERHRPRRERALQFGARAAVADGSELPDGAYTCVIEATGAPAAIADALGRIATRGTLLQVGAAPIDHEAALHPYDVFRREITIVGSFSVADAYPETARSMTTLAATMERFVTHRFPLEAFSDAFEAMRDPAAHKIQFAMDGA